jgi:hypothetical protein
MRGIQLDFDHLETETFTGAMEIIKLDTTSWQYDSLRDQNALKHCELRTRTVRTACSKYCTVVLHCTYSCFSRQLYVRSDTYIRSSLLYLKDHGSTNKNLLLRLGGALKCAC